MPFVEVAGRQAYCVQRRPIPTGQPPVVFIHGAGGTHQHWLYQVRDLSPSPTYAIDLPGHGRSDGPGNDSIQAYGDWVLAFLNAAGLERAILVGHSMGGGIALDVALRFPERVAGLGLVATGARLRVAPAILAGIREETSGLTASPSAAIVRLINDWAFGPEAPPEMVRLGQRQMSTTPIEVLYGDFCACDAFDLMDSLGEITTPACVLCGTHDSLTPAKYSVYLRDRLPEAQLHLVEGAGHMVMIEKPADVVRALSAFLGSLQA